jgi:multidrug efflux pump subunit AcrA (membrane-fusion protein)
MDSSIGTKNNSFLHAMFAIAICCTFILFVGCEKKETTAAPPAVEVVDVIQQDVPVKYEWIGTTDGMVNAVIRPMVSGYLTKQLYKEGDYVRKGQVLFEIDSRPFAAALRQAEGTLAQLEAQHANAEAERSLFNAELSYVQVRAALFRALINLYKAMGGGWITAADERSDVVKSEK